MSEDVQNISQDTSEFNVMFIHSDVDDAGLSVHAFRIMCHLSRRAGKGSCYPSASNMAKVCKMKRNTVFRAIKELKDRSMLTVENRGGDSNVYRITKPSSWTKAPEESTSAEKGPVSPNGTGGVPNGDTGGVPNGDTLSISNEVYPEKEIHSLPNSDIPSPKTGKVEASELMIKFASTFCVGEARKKRSPSEIAKFNRVTKALSVEELDLLLWFLELPKSEKYDKTWHRKGTFDTFMNRIDEQLDLAKSHRIESGYKPTQSGPVDFGLSTPDEWN